ncbi:uncharacterized protein [Watersipora subatra]|uniref:uncharacterized protein n=1 Tax=Watersipora subatra TaxID=2589382 RepID=UPI00355B6907
MRVKDEVVRSNRVRTGRLINYLDANTLDIWLHKKGGDFDIFDGKIVIHPGNYQPKKDYITVKRITATDRRDHVPELSRLEKINGDIYDFSTNKKHLKHPVEVWLPCHPITHPHLQEIKLKAKFKGEEEWTYHDWTLYGDDPQYPVMEFATDRLGVFVATVQPRVERVTVTDQGLLYNAKLNRYISLRFPKKCVDHDTAIEIRIIPFNMEKAEMVKESFRYNYPDLNDFELATDYFEILADGGATSFRRMVSVKLPTTADGFTEEHRDEIIIMRKDMELNQWFVVESNMKITRTTVAFDAKNLGRFVILRAPAKRKLRMKNALPVLETKMTKCRREILIFKKMLKKSWNVWIELVKPLQLTEVISKREADGIMCISRPEHVSLDLDGQPEYAVPVTREPSQSEVKLTDSELDFAKSLSENEKKESTLEFRHIYDVESEDNIQHSRAKPINKQLSRSKSIKKDYNYIEVDDGSDCGFIEVGGSVQPVEDAPLHPYFLENHVDNFMTFEIEPKSTDARGDIEAFIKYYVENTSASDGLVTKTLVRECHFTITAEQVAEYFYVEQEQEPVVDETKEEGPLSDLNIYVKDLVSAEEAAKVTAEKAREQTVTVRRLAAPLRPKRMIYREPRVLSGRSLQTLSRMIEEGLTLAVYLDMPDSTITGIGFDALSNGLSLSDVTYRILLRWKRSTRTRGDSAVEVLLKALSGMGREDIVSVVHDAHRRNSELTPASFLHLQQDDDGEGLQRRTSNAVPVKEFTF